MRVKDRHTLEELERLERTEKDAHKAKHIRVVLLALKGYTAPAISQAVGLSRRICQRWVYRYNEEGLDGLDDRRGNESHPASDQKILRNSVSALKQDRLPKMKSVRCGALIFDEFLRRNSVYSGP